MNQQLTLIEVVEKSDQVFFGHMKRMESARIPKITLEKNIPF